MTSWFDESPETYDRARPSYPEQLWDELFGRLPPAPNVLEIGPGTGKATAALLARGAAVVGCEPGANLARYLAAKFAGQRLTVRHAPFETAAVPFASFDAVVAATSFHWVRPDAGLAKARAVLKRGGWLAVLDTNQVASEVDRGYFAASHWIYREHFPDEPSDPPVSPGRDVLPPVFEQLKAAAGFGEPELFRVDWDQRYETEAYIDLVRSYSNTAMLGEVERERFLADLRNFIDSEFDGYVVRPLVITLCLARRPD